MAKTRTCVGVIFQFNSSGVLFEFSDGESEDAVGFVKATDIKINSKESIPPTANSTELLSKYLQAGDELSCTVIRKQDLDKFSYDEEEEEFDIDGKIKQNLKTNEIQPQWLATSAHLLASCGGDKEERKEQKTKSEEMTGFDQSELGVLEDQLGTLFDYDDVIFIEDVEIPDFDEPTNKAQDIPSPIVTQKQDGSTPENKLNCTSPKLVMPPSSKKSENPAIATNEKTQFDQAKLVQLVKPEAGNNCGKVVSAKFRISTGPFLDTEVVVANSCMYAWGHFLGFANLMITLQCGEECTIEYQLKNCIDKNGSSNLKNSSINVKTLWFGSKTTTPLKPGDDPLFSVWLSQRNIEEKDFLKWVRNQVPPKPFFPFISDLHDAKVIGYIQEDNFKALGVFLELGELVKKESERKFAGQQVVSTTLEPNSSKHSEQCATSEKSEGEKIGTRKMQEGESHLKKSGEKIRWSKKLNGKKEIAILLREDFYVCGVSVGCADLRLLLKINDIVTCQSRPLDDNDKKVLEKNFTQLQNGSVSQVAFIGFVGPQPPKESNLAPEFAPRLKKFLKNRGISMKEFEGMRYPPLQNAEISQHEGTQQPSIHPVDSTDILMGPRGSFCGHEFAPPGPMGQRFSHPYPMGQRFAPPGPLPGVFGPFIPQVPIFQINIATNLAARAVNITNPEDMRVRSLLHSPAEFAIGIKVAKVLTKALIHKAQGNIQNNQTKVKIISDLNSQQKELESLNQNVEQNQKENSSKSTSQPSEQNKSLLPTLPKEPKGIKENIEQQFRATKRPGQFLPLERSSKVGHFENKMSALHSSVLKSAPIVRTLLPTPSSSNITLNLPNTSVPPPKPGLIPQLSLEPIPLNPTTSFSPMSLDNQNLTKPAPVNDTSRHSMKFRVGPVPFTQSQERFEHHVAEQEIAGKSPTFERLHEQTFQHQKEQEQQKLWEEFIKKREEQKNREEELLIAKLREEELHRQKVSEEKRQKVLMIEEKLEKIRQKEEFEKIKQQQAEQEKARLQKEQDLIRKQQEMEQMRINLMRQEDFERKRMLEEQEKQRRFEEQERRRLEEQERRRFEEQEKRRFEEQEKRRFEEQEKRRFAEQERKRFEEQESKRLREEMERIRLKEEQEIIRLREEQERKRQKEEAEAHQFQCFREEQERQRLKNEMQRKKMREEEERKKEQQIKEIEQERLWKIEMEKRLRLQQQKDEVERQQDEQRQTNFHLSRPPPSLAHAFRGPPQKQHTSNVTAFDFRNSINLTEHRSGLVVPPPPPKLNSQSSVHNSIRPPPPPKMSSDWRYGNQNH